MFNNMREVHYLNKKGMDYIFTDLHGNYDLFQRALKLLDFNKTKDRVIIAGDLCDRGKQSLLCLKLLLEPWVLAVPGNHEQMLVEYVKNPYSMYGRAFKHNGGEWFDNYIPCDWEELGINKVVNKIETLPRMITFKDENDKVKLHVIHAELNVANIDRPITDADIEDEKTLYNMQTLSSWDGEYSFWGRAVFGDYYGHDFPQAVELSERDINRVKKFSSPDLSPIVSGHTVVDKPLKIGKLLNLDTCAFRGNLSGYCIQTDTIFTLNEDSEDFVNEFNQIDIKE